MVEGLRLGARASRPFFRHPKERAKGPRSRSLTLQMMSILMIYKPLLFFIACCFLTACDKEDADNISGSDVIRAASGIITAVRQFAPTGDQVQNLTTQEFESLHKFEYKVLEIAAGTQYTDISEQLSVLGKESWECFSMIPRGEKILVTCKRRPKSALNLIRNLSPLVN